MAAACKVPDRIIEGYVRDGSLQSIMREFDSNIKMCPNCGEITSQDGLCRECIKKLNNLKQLRDEINRDKVPDFKLPDKESHGMRYFKK